MCDDASTLFLRSPASTRSFLVDATFHRLQLGGISIIALCDGHFPLMAHDVLRSAEVPLERLLERARLDAIVPSHVNAFLIDDGVRRTLIDTGAGHLQDDTLGRVGSQLAAAGYAPSDIDTVLLTHLHPDHMGGLSRHGDAVFPRAIVYAPADESAFWLGAGVMSHVDESVRATFAHARSTLEPYIREARYRTFDPEAAWHGYLRAERLPGHTCGHTGYRVRTAIGDVVFCGDLFHVASVQLATPGVTVCYDSDPTLAQATREAFFAKASLAGDIIAAAHAPFPGLGKIQRDNDGYAWRPL